MITIAIVNDHPIIRTRMRAILDPAANALRLATEHIPNMLAGDARCEL